MFHKSPCVQTGTLLKPTQLYVLVASQAGPLLSTTGLIGPNDELEPDILALTALDLKSMNEIFDAGLASGIIYHFHSLAENQDRWNMVRMSRPTISLYHEEDPQLVQWLKNARKMPDEKSFWIPPVKGLWGPMHWIGLAKSIAMRPARCMLTRFNGMLRNTFTLEREQLALLLKKPVSEVVQQDYYQYAVTETKRAELFTAAMKSGIALHFTTMAYALAAHVAPKQRTRALVNIGTAEEIRSLSAYNAHRWLDILRGKPVSPLLKKEEQWDRGNKEGIQQRPMLEEVLGQPIPKLPILKGNPYVACSLELPQRPHSPPERINAMMLAPKPEVKKVVPITPKPAQSKRTPEPVRVSSGTTWASIPKLQQMRQRLPA